MTWEILTSVAKRKNVIKIVIQNLNLIIKKLFQNIEKILTICIN